MIPVKEFFVAGRAVFTIQVPEDFVEIHGTKPHYTYRIRIKQEEDAAAPRWYVDYLSGSDNLSSYSYLGRLNPETGNVLLTNKSRVTEDAWNYRILRRALACIFENKSNKITKSGFDVKHCGKCGKCGKTLTVPESIETGLGPICSKRS